MSSCMQSEYEARCHRGSDIVDHLPYLHARAAQDGLRAVELGVRSGESTAAFLAAVEAHDGYLWSVDVDRPDVPADFYGSRWTFIQGDDMGPGILEQLPEQFDLLFIDTSHRYQHTLDELWRYGPRVKPGGVILLHDTDLEVAPGSAADEDKEYPVRRAVVDWCKTTGFSPTFREGCNGLGVIEVDG